MNTIMINQLKQVSADMKAIMNKAEENGRIFTREDQELLDQLSSERDELLSNIIFHGHGTHHSNFK